MPFVTAFKKDRGFGRPRAWDEQQQLLKASWSESDHPRDSEGEFTTSAGGLSARVVMSPLRLADAAKQGFLEYFDKAASLGVPSLAMQTAGRPGGASAAMKDKLKEVEAYLYGNWYRMVVAPSAPGQMTQQQLTRTVHIINTFAANPVMRPYFAKFGEPAYIAAGMQPMTDDAAGNPVPARNPAQTGTLAQWTNGVVQVFGPSTGDENWLAFHGAPLVESVPHPYVAGTSEFGQGEGTMRHEYGHQIGNIILDPDRVPTPELPMSGKEAGEQFQRLCVNTDNPSSMSSAWLDMQRGKNLGPLSAYGMRGGPQEAFAEAFMVVTSPYYDDTVRMSYPPQTRAILDFVRGVVNL